MFIAFFEGIQQDVKLFFVTALVAAWCRAAFIQWYSPHRNFWAQRVRIFHCFRYGFWWGMDIHSYVFLAMVLLVSLPGAFLPGYFSMGDSARLFIMGFYVTVLYFAFMGKMIFYYHFHDIYNRTICLGKNADKKNLADIFFRQNHGGWILLGYFPFIWLWTMLGKVLLSLPSIPCPVFEPLWLRYAFAALTVLGTTAFYYFFHFGGTFRHRNKPEWDEVPPVVKENIFFSKAVVDDLVALKLIWKHPLDALLRHSDEESAVTMQSVLTGSHVDCQASAGPLAAFERRARGARISRPKHIFFLLGESYAQAPFDSIYEKLHLVEGGRAFRRDPHTFALENFLPAGMISQPALVSLLMGIYDADLELNENPKFWQGCMEASLPAQLKRLGYRTEFWYGGGLNWGSLMHFCPALGFDRCYGGPDICADDAPRTWLGVYDHIFLQQAAKHMKEEPADEPVFHFIYTTSNHGPFRMPLQELGFDLQRVMPEVPAAVRQDARMVRQLGVYWYADQALSAFVRDMQQTYPDSLILVTGDHSMGIIPYQYGVVERREPTLREQVCTSFAMYHRELERGMFVGNTIGGHMNLLPTIIEAVAPKGFSYTSLFPSLFEPVDHVVTPYHWLTRDSVGLYQDAIAQSLEISGAELPLRMGETRYPEEREGWRELTGWVVRHRT